MAAGLGTRLKPITDRLPKALVPIMGVPTIEFALQSLSLNGVRKPVVNIHHHAEILHQELGERAALSNESTLLLGSAGGVRKALQHLGATSFFVLNADTLCSVDLKRLHQTHAQMVRDKGVMITLAVHPRSPQSKEGYREIEIADGLVKGIGSKKTGKPFFTGVYIAEPAAFLKLIEGQPADLVKDVLEPAIKAGLVAAHVEETLWFDIGSPELLWETHYALIKLLEQDKLPATWRELIDEQSLQIKEQIWVSGGSPIPMDLSRWSGPAFWSGTTPPPSFGPNAVYYEGLGSSFSTS